MFKIQLGNKQQDDCLCMGHFLDMCACVAVDDILGGKLLQVVYHFAIFLCWSGFSTTHEAFNMLLSHVVNMPCM